MARSRLILHIGTHKTATSTLQTLMTKQREALASQGFHYPLTDREPLYNKNRHASFRFLLGKGGASFEALRSSMMTEFAASGCHTMVISDEGLAVLPLTKHLSALAPMSRDFDIEVVCVLRRQDFFAESLWNQRCKTGEQTLQIGGHIEEPDVVQYMTYLKFLDKWAEIGKVTALGFEAAREVGIVESFSKVTGMVLRADETVRNVSPSMTLAATLAVLNRGVDAPTWREVLPIMGDDGRRLAMGSRLRADLLARFADHNAALLDRYGVRFPETMPDEDTDPIAEPTEREVRRVLRSVRRAKEGRPPLPARPGGRGKNARAKST